MQNTRELKDRYQITPHHKESLNRQAFPSPIVTSMSTIDEGKKTGLAMTEEKTPPVISTMRPNAQ